MRTEDDDEPLLRPSQLERWPIHSWWAEYPVPDLSRIEPADHAEAIRDTYGPARGRLTAPFEDLLERAAIADLVFDVGHEERLERRWRGS